MGQTAATTWPPADGQTALTVAPVSVQTALTGWPLDGASADTAWPVDGGGPPPPAVSLPAVTRPATTADLLQTTDDHLLPSGDFAIIALLDVTGVSAVSAARLLSYGSDAAATHGIQLELSISATPDRLQVRFCRDVAGSPSVVTAQVVLGGVLADVVAAGRFSALIQVVDGVSVRLVVAAGGASIAGASNGNALHYPASAVAPIVEMEQAAGTLSWAVAAGVVDEAAFVAYGEASWDAPRELIAAEGLTLLASRTVSVADGADVGASDVTWEVLGGTSTITAGTARLTAQDATP